jgi:hypothetical protein
MIRFVRLPILAAPAIVGAVLLCVASAGSVAQDRATAPPDPFELVGAPVFTADGCEVGQVAAVTVKPDGMIGEMRMTTATPLGIGQRMVVIPLEGIVVLRGAVVLDLSPSELDMLPNAAVGDLENPTRL